MGNPIVVIKDFELSFLKLKFKKSFSEDLLYPFEFSIAGRDDYEDEDEINAQDFDNGLDDDDDDDTDSSISDSDGSEYQPEGDVQNDEDQSGNVGSAKLYYILLKLFFYFQ